MIRAVDEILWESELEVVFSLMSDSELLSMRERLEMSVKEKAYQTPKFPLSAAGINYVVSIVMFMYWMRRGKGVKIDGGEVVVCELEESPFVQKYMKVEKEEDVEVGDLVTYPIGNKSYGQGVVEKVLRDRVLLRVGQDEVIEVGWDRVFVQYKKGEHESEELNINGGEEKEVGNGRVDERDGEGEWV